ncbi:MAG: type II secretion system major pseudopilin GspG [Deltaproteobacteria bacterium]|nr:type II secretion system major pseudopilin GspG [Deltaproteobacteria bacterium]
MNVKKLLGSSRGMTLIEIMVVITILGLIATVVTVNVIGRLDEAKVDTAKTQIKSFEDALEHFRRDAGFYPSTEQGLQALVEKPSIGRIPKRFALKGYLKSIPKDPWGCDFTYYSPGLQGHEFEIYSLGADCQEGGEALDADIPSFEAEGK